jgi:hypothetical protein
MHFLPQAQIKWYESRSSSSSAGWRIRPLADSKTTGMGDKRITRLECPKQSSRMIAANFRYLVIKHDLFISFAPAKETNQRKAGNQSVLLSLMYTLLCLQMGEKY